MKKIRAIIINPNDKTVTEKMIDPTFKEMYQIVGCDTLEANYSGTILSTTGHFLYIDEEGSFKKEKNYYLILGAHSPLCGIGILLKYNEHGEEKDCTLPVEEVIRNIRFYNI